MRFPSIKNVASALQDVSADLRTDGNDYSEENACDVRLQVYPNGDWALRVGLSDYDTDHHGYWGASCLDGKRFNSRTTAKYLIEQAREQKATDANENSI